MPADRPADFRELLCDLKMRERHDHIRLGKRTCLFFGLMGVLVSCGSRLVCPIAGNAVYTQT